MTGKLTSPIDELPQPGFGSEVHAKAIGAERLEITMLRGRRRRQQRRDRSNVSAHDTVRNGCGRRRHRSFCEIRPPCFARNFSALGL